MNDELSQRRWWRLLAAILVALWAATAVAIAAAYRPGGPVDVIVVLACFPPVLVAALALEWPPRATTYRHRAALAWLWIAAVLFAIPVLYGVSTTLGAGGLQDLVPSAEAAYAGIVALFLMSAFSVVGLVHQRRGVAVFELAATWRSALLAGVLTLAISAAFGLVALINDLSLQSSEATTSRYGPTDPALVPPYCDERLALGPNAVVTITARSSLDNRPRGSAVLQGQRGGVDEVWGGSWDGPDGSGKVAYLRVGDLAWLNRGSDDPAAPGTTWQQVTPGLFDMEGEQQLTMDGPPFWHVDKPRGSLVAEDLGLEVVEGARARHCRTFIDGSAALATFLPLRWLLNNDPVSSSDQLQAWRGEMDWWVFGDGQLGRASVEITGRRAETPWLSTGVRAVLEAQLEATDRMHPIDVAATAATVEGPLANASPTTEATPLAPAVTNAPEP